MFRRYVLGDILPEYMLDELESEDERRELDHEGREWARGEAREQRAAWLAEQAAQEAPGPEAE